MNGRFDFTELEAHLDQAPTRVLAERLGVSARTVWRWRATGLNPIQADHAAIKLGLHPGSVWASWWNSAA
ncbi:MAG: helix-turn-helix domain-containing protein [Acidimicrobiales bacterium]